MHDDTPGLLCLLALPSRDSMPGLYLLVLPSRDSTPGLHLLALPSCNVHNTRNKTLDCLLALPI